MAEIVAYICAPLLLLAITVWLYSGGRSSDARNPLTIQECLNIDEDYLNKTGYRLAEHDAMLQQIKAERRDTAIAYLDAVRDDYLRVEHLLNRAAKFLPELTLAGETVRVFVGIKFRLGYRLARLEIRCGFLPAKRLKTLTAQFRLASVWAGKALNEVSREHGLAVLESDLRSG